ncbi:MAG: helix-turn-helix domain-containing protein, partial [Oscillospiraceae bacterium]
MSIGNRIRDARENLGLSRGQLADMIGVTISAISNYENNISFPKEPI